MKGGLLKISALALFLAPTVTFAQQPPGDFTGLAAIMFNIIGFINGPLITFIFAIAFLVILWGIFKTFILGANDEGKRSEGKTLIIYGVAAFVIMIAFWGIVNFFVAFLNLNDAGPADLPQAPGPSGSFDD